MKQLSVFGILMILGLMVFGQESNNGNPRIERPFSFKMGMDMSAYDGYDFYYRFSVGYFLNPHVELEAASGIPSYFSVGANYHMNSENSVSNFSPFVGAGFGLYDGFGAVSLPVGLNYISQRGFTAAISLNNRFSLDNSLYAESSIQVDPYIQLSIGWTFRK